MSGRTSSRMSIFSKSASHRSGVIHGIVGAKEHLVFEERVRVLHAASAKNTSATSRTDRCRPAACAGRPRSPRPATGNDGCARMIGMSGKSTATSSMCIGLPYFSRIPPPPGMPGADAAVARVEQHRQPRFGEHLVERIRRPGRWRRTAARGGCSLRPRTAPVATSRRASATAGAPRVGSTLANGDRDVGVRLRELDHRVVR